MNIAMTSESLSVLFDRARIYSFFSGLFSDPDVEKFRLLQGKEVQRNLIESCRRLQTADGRLAERAASVVALLSDTDTDRIKDEHTRVFGHTLSKETSPYELEFLKNKEVFSQTQGLADITGFYSAFGLQVDASERADHIAVQAEFLSFLILKEALAIENDLSEENAKVCRQAQKDFAQDHFSWWTKRLADKLRTQPASAFYSAAGEFLKQFLETEDMK